MSIVYYVSQFWLFYFLIGLTIIMLSSFLVKDRYENHKHNSLLYNIGFGITILSLITSIIYFVC